MFSFLWIFRRRRPRRNDDDNENGSSYLFNACGRPVGEVKVINLNHKSKMQIHRYVLTQFQELLQPFERYQILMRPIPRKIVDSIGYGPSLYAKRMKVSSPLLAWYLQLPRNMIPKLYLLIRGLCLEPSTPQLILQHKIPLLAWYLQLPRNMIPKLYYLIRGLCLEPSRPQLILQHKIPLLAWYLQLPKNMIPKLYLLIRGLCLEPLIPQLILQHKISLLAWYLQLPRNMIPKSKMSL
ncbi:uncharacterized protein LOC130815510 [Amaranthus tricolor]|uniref:uncharacterized protein LOC130815510 n=1 Tax=Amaranthus tricolor TaxID=29722 RepID=UPI002584F2B3|nr:uncharacterized protein LOC130815510 [Amaranthus tricolor]